MSTYRVTIKYWDRHYGDGHVQFKRNFEARTSAKANQEAINILETALKSHPNPQGRIAEAWAEVSDRSGPRTLRKYDGTSGQWVRVDPMRPSTHESRRVAAHGGSWSDYRAAVVDYVRYWGDKARPNHFMTKADGERIVSRYEEEVRARFRNRESVRDVAKVLWDRWQDEDLKEPSRRFAREPHRVAVGGRQATKPGRHGTLKLWTLTYTDGSNPAFGEDSIRTWAYDREAAALAFNEQTESDGESWEIVKIEPVLDTGPKKLSIDERRVAATGGPSLPKAVQAMRVYLGSVDFASVRAQQRLYDRAMKAVNAVARARNMDPSDVWQQIESQARREGIIRPRPGKDY